MMTRPLSVLLVLIGLSIVVPPSSATAQFLWPRWTEPASIRVEYLAPITANEAPGADVSCSVISISGRYAISDRSTLVAEIPYASTSAKYSPPFGSGSTSVSALGNIYVGEIEDLSRIAPGLFTEIGVRLPTLAEGKGPATWLGVVGDFNRREAYLPNLLTVQAALNDHHVSEHGLATFFRAGASVWIPTKLDSMFSRLTKILLDYGMGIGYEDESVRVGAGISGRAIMKETKTLYENKRAFHHFELGVNGTIGPVRPGAFYRIPLDPELRRYVGHTLGFYASVAF